MSSLVVVSVTDGREPLRTELALVRFLSRVNPNVNLQIPSLVKLLVANHFLASFGIGTDYLSADEILFFLFLRGHFTEILQHGNWHGFFPFLVIMAAELSEAKVGQIVIELIENKVPINIRVMVLFMIEAGAWLYHVLLRETGQLWRI